MNHYIALLKQLKVINISCCLVTEARVSPLRISVLEKLDPVILPKALRAVAKIYNVGSFNLEEVFPFEDEVGLYLFSGYKLDNVDPNLIVNNTG